MVKLNIANVGGVQTLKDAGGALRAIPITVVAPSSHTSWTEVEKSTFERILDGQNFIEKEFWKHPFSEGLHRSVKSVRKYARQIGQIDEAIFKKKWLQNEKETLEAAIAAHGFKLKAILKDETFAEGLADKSVKQIDTRLKKAALKSLQERNGGKHSPHGGRGKPEAILSKEDFEKVLKIVFKKFEAVAEHPMFTADLGCGGFDAVTKKVYKKLAALVENPRFVQQLYEEFISS